MHQNWDLAQLPWFLRLPSALGCFAFQAKFCVTKHMCPEGAFNVSGRWWPLITNEALEDVATGFSKDLSDMHHVGHERAEHCLAWGLGLPYDSPWLEKHCETNGPGQSIPLSLLSNQGGTDFGTSLGQATLANIAKHCVVSVPEQTGLSVVHPASCVVRRPSSVIRHPSSILCRPLSVVRRRSSVLGPRSSVVCHPPSSSVGRRPLSSVLCPPSCIVRRLTRPPRSPRRLRPRRPPRPPSAAAVVAAVVVVVGDKFVLEILQGEARDAEGKGTMDIMLAKLQLLKFLCGDFLADAGFSDEQKDVIRNKTDSITTSGRSLDTLQNLATWNCAWPSSHTSHHHINLSISPFFDVVEKGPLPVWNRVAAELSESSHRNWTNIGEVQQLDKNLSNMKHRRPQKHYIPKKYFGYYFSHRAQIQLHH